MLYAVKFLHTTFSNFKAIDKILFKNILEHVCPFFNTKPLNWNNSLKSVKNNYLMLDRRPHTELRYISMAVIGSQCQK